MELTDRQTWTDEDFRDVFAFIVNTRAILRDCPDKAAELASVLLEDADRAAKAMVYIMRGTGAMV